MKTFVNKHLLNNQNLKQKYIATFPIKKNQVHVYNLLQVLGFFL